MWEMALYSVPLTQILMVYGIWELPATCTVYGSQLGRGGEFPLGSELKCIGQQMSATNTENTCLFICTY